MPSKPLRSQLNQIRAWVRQGRTDAWIAHQLEVSTAELREFRRRHDLEADGEGVDEVDLRDEIEAQIEATMEAEETEDAEPDDDEPDDEDNSEQPRPRRRRRRRGGRGRRGGGQLQATFDHGEDEGFGLWLDPAVQDNPVYAEHWAGHRPVEVTIAPDQIVIRRAESADAD